MTSTTKAWIAAGVAVVFALALIVWQVKARRSESLNLSAEDMAMIAEEQSPQFRTRLASDANARKDFADDLRKLLAVAAPTAPPAAGRESHQAAAIVNVIFYDLRVISTQGDPSFLPTLNTSILKAVLVQV